MCIFPVPPGSGRKERNPVPLSPPVAPPSLSAAVDCFVGGRDGSCRSSLAEPGGRGGGTGDELLVTIVPVVLGEGKSMFDRPGLPGPLQLLGTRTLESGIAEWRYEIPRYK